MPKNDNSNENQDNVDAVDAAPQVPASVYTPPVVANSQADAAVAESASDVASAAPQASRRWGTGVIIGLSAASLALLAGAFGGGVAVGATADNHGPGGSGGHSEQASGPMQGDSKQDGPRQDGPKQGGPQQGAPMHGNQMQDSDSDGPRDGKMPHPHDGNGQNLMPSDTGDLDTGTSSSTPTPMN